MSDANNHLVPGPDPLVKPQLIGTILSGFFYGLVISLFCHCLYPLLMSCKRSYSNRLRWFLITYITVMFLLSTSAFLQAVIYIMKTIFQQGEARERSQQISLKNEPFVLPFTLWGADGLMVWRCIILYGNTSRIQRAFLYCVLGLLSLVSTGAGILYYTTPLLSDSFKTVSSIQIMSTISVTTLVNLILAGLIAGRLITHQENMRRVLGPGYGSPYMRLIIMLVESCALIVVNGLIYVSIYLRTHDTNSACIIPLLIFPHISVISPLLIVYGVGTGRAITKTAPPPIKTPNLGGNDVVSQPICFSDPTSALATRSDTEKQEELLQRHDSRSTADIITYAT